MSSIRRQLDDLNRVELAWAAGFFDGEGWFSVPDRGQSLELGVGQKMQPALERFQAAVGVGRIYRERNNTFFSWRATNAADQYRTIRLLWPYMTEPKKAQGRDALQRLRERRSTLTRRVAAVERTLDLMEEVMQ